MKFLLVAINAKYIHSNLAVYSLKAFAEKYGNNNNEIEIAEYTINQYSDDILRDIYKRKPDAVGFSCYIWNIGMVKEIVRDYKKICPNVALKFPTMWSRFLGRMKPLIMLCMGRASLLSKK